MDTPDSDQFLINDTLKGNSRSFKLLVDRYSAFAYNLAFRILKDTQEAEEASQDAFVKVFRALIKYNGSSKFSTWLYTIVYRECLNRLKKKKVYTTEINETTMAVNLVSKVDNGLDLLSNQDRRNMINKALNSLNSKEAAVLTLFYLEEQSLKETSTITGMALANVKVVLHRGRKNMLSAVQSMTGATQNEWL